MLNRLATVVLCVLATSAIAVAQTTPPAPKAPAAVSASKGTGDPTQYPPKDETPAQRMERLGTAEDPGADPDPERVWTRFGHHYRIQKYAKKDAKFDQPYGFVRPYWPVNVYREIYAQNDEWIWVWEPYIDRNPEVIKESVEAAAPRKLTPEDVKWVSMMKDDFSELTVPDSKTVIRFREASNGLPTAGSWRNTLAVADMNEDGFLDIVAPAQRGGGDSLPYIFLGDGKGNWKEWEQASFPRALNYGGIAVGDLNRDGHQDIAFGVHLWGVAAFLGDGKGNFTDASEGLSSQFPTRRVVLEDIDNDRDLDIIAITEGPTLRSRANQSRPENVQGSKIRIFVNDGKAKWREAPVGEPARQVGGDYLATGDFNGDNATDLVGSSIYVSGNDLMYLGGKKKLEFKPFGRGFLPFFSLYSAVVADRFSSTKRDDVILTYARYWPAGANREFEPPQEKTIAGIERVSWTNGEVQRKPIMRWRGSKGVFGMTSADFDRDGKVDLLFARNQPREFVMLLGNGKGDFTRARIEGIERVDLSLYDIVVADVNKDGRPDVLVPYEASEGEKNGTIRVYLNEGA